MVRETGTVKTGRWVTRFSSPHKIDLNLKAHNGGIRISDGRSEEHTSELQSRFDLVCRLLLEKKKSSRSLIYCSTRAGVPMRSWMKVTRSASFSSVSTT